MVRARGVPGRTLRLTPVSWSTLRWTLREGGSTTQKVGEISQLCLGGRGKWWVPTRSLTHGSLPRLTVDYQGFGPPQFQGVT